MSDHGSGQDHPPPGWYPDPERPGNRRWWDGLAWTDFSEPLEGGGSSAGQPTPTQSGSGPGSSPGGAPGGYSPPTGPSSGSFGGTQGGYGGGYAAPGAAGGPPGGYGTPSYAAPGSYGGAAPKIDPWLWQSIVVTLLCCLPLGIVGIIFASQAQTELGRGNYGEAQEKAKQAKTFTLIGFGIGLAGIFIWVPLFMFA